MGDECYRRKRERYKIVAFILEICGFAYNEAVNAFDRPRDDFLGLCDGTSPMSIHRISEIYQRLTDTLHAESSACG